MKVNILLCITTIKVLTISAFLVWYKIFHCLGKFFLRLLRPQEIGTMEGIPLGYLCLKSNKQQQVNSKS